MVTKTQAIKAFLSAMTHQDLAALYNYGMECQVNVAQDNGEKVDGEFNGVKWNGYSDGITTWKPIRIPYNAAVDPVYDDTEMKYDIHAHAEGIGMTGWDWKNKVSKWVAFDFDAITGHADTHNKKLTAEELKRIQEVCYEVPWVTVRYSTGGKGIHLYVFLNDVPTLNHTEHAGLARSILTKLSSLTGYDFHSKVDICVPGNTWTLTSDGPRQVKDLINTPTMLMVNGKKYKTDGFFKSGYREVYEVETVEGYKVQATDNHPFLVNYDGLELWQELKSLSVGDEVILNRHSNVSWEGEGTYNEGYILGWLMGDGTLSESTKSGGQGLSKEGYLRNYLYFHKFDHCMVEYVKAMFKQTINSFHNEETDCISLFGREIEDLRIRFGLDKYKEISYQVEIASSEFLRGFVSAFFDTDGSVDSKHAIAELTQSNLERLEAVQRILNNFGIYSSIRKERDPGTMMIQGRLCNCKAKFCLSIRREDVEVFRNQIGFKHPEKRIKLEKNIERVQSGRKRLLPSKNIVRIKSIKLIGKENVYDVFVNGIHAFDANGFYVHNCGGNMWVWHRKMRGTEGLKIVKAGGKLDEIPPNWKDHIRVVKGVNKKLNAPTDISTLEDSQSKFDLLSGQRTKVKLDVDHLKLIKFLNENGLYHWWDADHHMLVTHTMHLKRAHKELDLKGIFETITTGTTTHNCFAYPMRRGSWSVRRYSPGCKEHPSWDQDGAGWTRCYLNTEPTLASAANAHGGLEDPSGGYHFQSGDKAQNAANALGANVIIPPKYASRSTIVKPHKDGRLIIEFPVQDQNDLAQELEGWLRKGNKWVKMFAAPKTNSTENDSDNYDDLVRHIITDQGEDAGWVINSDGRWNDEPLTHVRAALTSMSIKKPEIEGIVGSSVMKPWTLVTRPFESEYPGDRIWNRRAPQFRYVPTVGDVLNYPTYWSILCHIGGSLNDTISRDPWCKKNGVKSGADYLKIWIASMIQYPTEPTPYLFIYGEKQETGKSTLHESLELLFSPGYKRVDQALQNPNGFNGELEGCILGVIEETDFNKNRTAQNRMKDYVTARKFSLRALYRNPVMIINMMHFIQTANYRTEAPPFDEADTRITMIHVKDKPRDQVPKRLLIKQLEKEAPDFLGSLVSLEIPESDSRLRVPVIHTADKTSAAKVQKNALRDFIDDQCFQAPGHCIKLSEFFDRFVAWLEPNERGNWSSKQKVSQAMPDWVVKGRMSTDANWYWGNISFHEPKVQSRPYMVVNDKLVVEGE